MFLTIFDRNQYLGGIPGPLIYGAVIDSSCIQGKSDCDGNFLSCQVYDTNGLKWRVLSSKNIFYKAKFFILIFSLFGWEILHHAVAHIFYNLYNKTGKSVQN